MTLLSSDTPPHKSVQGGKSFVGINSHFLQKNFASMRINIDAKPKFVIVEPNQFDFLWDNDADFAPDVHGLF